MKPSLHASVKGLKIGAHEIEGQLIKTAPSLGVQAFHAGTDTGVNSALVVSSQGSIFYSPATRHHIKGEDVGCSRDRGQAWQIINVPRTHELPADYPTASF